MGLFLIVISRLASLVLPVATKYLMDGVIPNKDLGLLQTLIIVVIVSLAVNAVTSYMLTQLLSVEAQHLISQLRVKVQKKILSLPTSYFDNNKSVDEKGNIPEGSSTYNTGIAFFKKVLIKNKTGGSNAVYYRSPIELHIELDMKQALEWADKAVAANPKAYWVVLLKAKIQVKLKDNKGASATAAQVVTLAKEDQNDDYVKMAEKIIADAKGK